MSDLPVQPSSSITPSQMPETPQPKKSSYHPHIIGFITLIVIFGLGYFFGTKQLNHSEPVPSPVVSASPLVSPDLTANWKIHTDENVSFKYPSEWTEGQPQTGGSSNLVEFTDPSGTYKLIFLQRGNYSQITGQPYTDLYEALNLPQYTKKVTVGGQEGLQGLPRAGSENINAVDFFSKDTKFINHLELTTQIISDATVSKGQEIFNQILSTFKFTE